MYSYFIKSIKKTIEYEDCIKEEDLSGINLSYLTNRELSQLLENAVGYAETLIEFEIESRGRHD